LELLAATEKSCLPLLLPFATFKPAGLRLLAAVGDDESIDMLLFALAL
jgi:hypothetical protein